MGKGFRQNRPLPPVCRPQTIAGPGTNDNRGGKPCAPAAATMIGLIPAGRIGLGLVLDHFGLLGYTQKLINRQRVLGAVLAGWACF